MKYEYLANIAGVDYDMTQLSNIRLRHPLFATFGIGSACSAQLNVSYYSDVVPAGLESVKIYYRERGSSEPWILRGTYIIAETTVRNDMVSLVAYDYMLKTETPYLINGGGDSGDWPRSMTTVVQEIADAIGVGVDSRTNIPSTYQQEYPIDYTMREVLCHIAAACGGNWIITPQNNLLLVPLATSMPAETFNLITEDGSAILVGGVRIRV